MRKINEYEMLNKLNKQRFLLFIPIITVVIYLQWSLIVGDPVTEYDDILLLKPLQTINIFNFGQYLDAISNRLIYDVQPIRDLSFLIDLKMFDLTGISIHHFTNVFLWLLIIWNLLSTFSKLSFSKETTIILILLAAFHPVFWQSISWISARKHLLSVLFIILATNHALKLSRDEKIKWSDLLLISTYYLMACFSQPINVGWIAWFAFHLNSSAVKPVSLKQSIQINFRWLVLPGLVTVMVLALNLLYYSSVQVANENHVVSKFLNTEISLAYRILSIGRSFWQILIPIQVTPTPWYLGHEYNFYGMLLAVLMTFIIYRMRSGQVWKWFIFSILPLIVINFRTTNIFGSDTYLLIPGLGFFIGVGVAYEERVSRFSSWAKKLLLILLVSVFGYFLYKDREVVNSWISTDSVFKYASHVEATPFNYRAYAYLLQQQGKYEESLPYAVRLIEWDPFAANVEVVFAMSIIKNQSLSLKNKKDLVEFGLRHFPQSLWIHYAKSLLLASEKNFGNACHLLDAFKYDRLGALKRDLMVILSSYRLFCRGDETYESRLAELEKIARSKHFKWWNEERYQQLLKARNPFL